MNILSFEQLLGKDIERGKLKIPMGRRDKQNMSHTMLMDEELNVLKMYILSKLIYTFIKQTQKESGDFARNK